MPDFLTELLAIPSVDSVFYTSFRLYLSLRVAVSNKFYCASP